MHSNVHSGPSFLTTISAKRDHRRICDSTSRKAHSRPFARRNRREARLILRNIALVGDGDFTVTGRNARLTGRHID